MTADTKNVAAIVKYVHTHMQQFSVELEKAFLADHKKQEAGTALSEEPDSYAAQKKQLVALLENVSTNAENGREFEQKFRPVDIYAAVNKIEDGIRTKNNIPSAAANDAPSLSAGSDLRYELEEGAFATEAAERQRDLARHALKLGDEGHGAYAQDFRPGQYGEPIARGPLAETLSGSRLTRRRALDDMLAPFSRESDAEGRRLPQRLQDWARAHIDGDSVKPPQKGR